MSEDEKEKALAREMMRHLGIELRDIPQNNTPTPDFAFEIVEDEFTIELKSKGDDSESEERFYNELEKGHVVSESTPILPRNKLDGVIGDGVGQMAKFDAENRKFRIIWLHCAGRKPDLHWRRFHATLFGSATLISLEKTSTLLCYYFYDSSFFRHRDSLDGAILSTPTGQFQLCINSLSPRADRFRSTELVRRAAAGLCDPTREEGRSGALIADCMISRKNTADVLEYLKGKYSIGHLQEMTMNQFSGSIKFPTDERPGT